MMLCNIMECHCNVQCLLLYYISEVENEERPPQLTYSRHQTLETLCILLRCVILRNSKLLNKFTVVSKIEIRHANTSMLCVSLM